MTTEHVPSKEQLPQGWIPLGQGFGWITDRLMLKTPEFIINNWDCKYVNARIDMRTGSVRLEPGNVNSAHLREMPHCSTCSCPPYDAERQAAQIATLKGYISRTALAGYRCAECAERLAPAITSHTVEITAEQRQMLTARGVGEIPGGAHEPTTAPIEQYEHGLAELYRKHYIDVAQVCDDLIDKSGALLGRVRALARATQRPVRKYPDPVTAFGNLAKALPAGFEFPTMTQAAERIECPTCGQGYIDEAAVELREKLRAAQPPGEGA